jgi:hypothetical protein
VAYLYREIRDRAMLHGDLNLQSLLVLGITYDSTSTIIFNLATVNLRNTWQKSVIKRTHECIQLVGRNLEPNEMRQRLFEPQWKTSKARGSDYPDRELNEATKSEQSRPLKSLLRPRILTFGHTATIIRAHVKSAPSRQICFMSEK